ncbi:leukotriene B4 receptor 1-like [Denticeps clupeoides]|uniref:G-protein coupled receptors family 1 profile domain-containing protein n=1 Tax=Denticeps clupeoides TaxID=299321 RepID=A0AAY4A7H9_9TELE|nr:leukotriene B4 receptor 1-like [Denticeps clupeoides]
MDEDYNVSNIVGAFIFCLVFLLGGPGNFFIIWSILTQSHKRTITTLLILNLAIADGCLMCLTVFFVIYMLKQNWVFGSAMCKVIYYLCNSNMYTSVMFITLMSLHRLMVIVWPRRASVLSKRRNIIHALLALWILVPLLSVPVPVFMEVRSVGNHSECAANHTTSRQVVSQYTFETVMGFLIPYAMIVSSYVCILRRLRQTKFKRSVHSENLILAIIIVFGLFWFPYHVMNMIQVGAALAPQRSELKKSLEKIGRDGRPVTSALAFISSCANPVLYTYAARSYIRANGLAFMARLFEGTALDLGLKKIRQRDGLGLKIAESSSTTGNQDMANGQ